MHVTGIDLLLWIVGFVLHILLFSVISVRRRAREFPLFTALIALSILRTIALFIIERKQLTALYFYSFWSLALVDVTLQFGVVYELASKIFRPLGEWARDVRGRLLIWVGASICIGLLLTMVPKPPNRFWIQVVVLKGSFLSAALMSELFVGMIALSAIAGLAWPSLTVRIGKGLGIYFMATLLFETANTCLGLAGHAAVYLTLTKIRIFLYLCCVAYWIYSFWVAPRSTREMPDDIRMQAFAIGEAVRRRLDVLRTAGEP